MEWLLYIVVAVIILIVIMFIIIYNSIIVLENRIANAWAQIDVQLKKRNDLIPNIVNTVKGYAKHEKGVFTDVTKARTSVMNAQTIEQKAKASDMLTGALKSLFAVAEAYPQLQASQNFLNLQEELSSIEDKIAYGRQFYNDSVLNFNNKVETFPSSIIAGIMGRNKEKPYFEVAEAERKTPKVSFE